VCIRRQKVVLKRLREERAIPPNVGKKKARSLLSGAKDLPEIPLEYQKAGRTPRRRRGFRLSQRLGPESPLQEAANKGKKGRPKKGKISKEPEKPTGKLLRFEGEQKTCNRAATPQTGRPYHGE